MRLLTYDDLAYLRTVDLRGLLSLSVCRRTQKMLRYALRERGRL